MRRVAQAKTEPGAIQVQSEVLTFPVFSNFTYVCDRLFPTSPDATNPGVANTCQYGPGTVAFAVDVPIDATYEGTTVWTQIQLIDPSSPPLTLACIEVPLTPYRADRWWWHLLFWLPIALFIAYFALVAAASVILAITMRARAFRSRAREGSAPTLITDKISPAIVSALSGQGVSLSPSLLRFATPGCWDILHHTQFIVGIAMLAVRWPDFAYPFLRQVAWSALLGNVTLVEDSPVSASHAQALLPSGDIGAQMGNSSSPLFMDERMPNNLLDLGAVYTGIEAYARMIGLRESQLFGTCLAIWLLIIAAVAVASLLAYGVDVAAEAWVRRQRQEEVNLEPTEVKGGKGGMLVDADGHLRDGSRGAYGFLGALPGMRTFRGASQLHRKALHGNVIRALALFHFPITILSVWQFARADGHSTTSVALAALAYALVSVLAPLYLLWRIARADTSKLYDDVSTLIALGPVYNTFSPGSQLFCAVTFGHSFVLGTVIGAGQRSGSAQAIILLVLELLLALAYGLWLPYAEGAMNGPVSFLCSVVRVISAVLLVLLTPLVGFGRQACGWIAYVILLLQGIFFLGALLVLAAKLVEAVVRIAWRVPHDTRASGRSAGLAGAIRRIRRRKDKTLQLASPGNKRHSGASSNGGIMRPQTQRSSSGTSTNAILRPAAPPRTSTSSTQSGMLSRSQARPGAIPLTHSRHGSYASYLDSQLYAKGESSSAPALDPNPYSVYYRSAPDDDDDIMASMPPQSPSWPAATALPRNRAPSPIREEKFVRVRGARTTDADPYAAHAAAAAAAEDSSEDDTWNSSTVQAGGRWKGVARMAALLRRLGNAPPASSAEGTLSPVDETPSGGGFQVVRAPRPRPSAPASADADADSTALAAAAAKRSSSGSFGGRGQLGMLAADLQRAPSTLARDDAEPQGGDDNFWLPPRTGGEGMVRPSEDQAPRPRMRGSFIEVSEPRVPQEPPQLPRPDFA
jgi:hypothetical protein